MGLGILNIDQYDSRAAVHRRGGGAARGQAGHPVCLREPRTDWPRALCRRADQHLRPGRDRPAGPRWPGPPGPPPRHGAGLPLGPDHHPRRPPLVPGPARPRAGRHPDLRGGRRVALDGPVPGAAGKLAGGAGGARGGPPSPGGAATGSVAAGAHPGHRRRRPGRRQRGVVLATVHSPRPARRRVVAGAWATWRGPGQGWGCGGRGGGGGGARGRRAWRPGGSGGGGGRRGRPRRWRPGRRRSWRRGDGGR
jgi:translation initiation factor IF-2